MISPISRRRSPMQIVADILTVANGGARITQIVYKANLNFQRAAKYLEMLVKRGFIKASKEPGSTRVIYWTTEKGKQFLMQYKQMKEMLASSMSPEDLESL